MIEKAIESPITDEMSEKIESKYKKIFEDESQKYNVFVHEGFTTTRARRGDGGRWDQRQRSFGTGRLEHCYGKW